MLYVAMTRGRHNNEAFLYQRFGNEADHDHSEPESGDGIHVARRDNKYSAAQHFRMILANDDRPAPCTSKPNGRHATYFQNSSTSIANATAIAVAAGKPPGGPSSADQ